MKTRKTRRWYDRAACSEDDPDTWDTPMTLGAAWLRGDRERAREFMASAARCDGCPVLSECARDALRCIDHGTIRGGVPLPDKDQQSARELLPRARAALLLVANGAPASKARVALLNDMPPARNKGGGSK